MDRDTNSTEKDYNDFRYMEFIRNPQNMSDDISEIQCIALDYFDLIYMKKVDTFQECMTMDNGIPCEAYQSIGLFRKGEEEEGEEEEEEEDPFKLSKEMPFFAVLQVTLTPVYYKKAPLNCSAGELMDLEILIDGVKQDFLGNFDALGTSKFAVRTAVYYTVNTMDFCIVLKTNRLEFPLFLSNEIKIKSTKEDSKYKKYAVYTMMGIYKNFENLSGYEFIGEKTALVTRVHLKPSQHRECENLIREITQKESERKNCAITDTHGIPGRYDLTIRVNGKDNILSVLPGIIRAIMESFANEEGDRSSNEHAAKEEPWNSLDYIIDKGYAEYLNVRIFSDCKDCFGDPEENYLNIEDDKEKDSKIEDDQQEGLLDIVKEKYESLEGVIKKNELEPYLKGYMSKLRQIVHICIAMYNRYDTNISIELLSDYLVDFMALVQMNIEFFKKGSVSLKDIGMNLVRGINYLQQFIKIVTSVNTSSFEAPKYETEKDECCIVKLPIAYTQFLTGIFKKYYEDRNSYAFKKGKDKEVQFFPEYVPLVIPYMQNGNKKYMMTTLFPQSMSDDWSGIQDDWVEHIKNNKVLMFIICQDMDDYRNVSSVISASLHEIGHYCNGMTRAQRNEDLVHIFSEEIAKVIVKKCMVLMRINFQLSAYASRFSLVIQKFKDSIYEGLVDWFLKAMKEEIGYPESVFQCKFLDKFYELTNVYADCGDQKITDEKLLGSFLDEVKYTFDLDIQEEKQDELEKNISSAISNKCKELLVSLEKELKKCKGEIPFFEEIKEYSKTAGELCAKMEKGNVGEVLNKANIIKSLTEKIKLKLYCRWGEKQKVSEDLCRIRRISMLLQEVGKSIKLLLKGIQKVQILEINDYKSKCGKLKKTIELKSDLLKEICRVYHEKCHQLYPEYFQKEDGFAEVYQRMNLYPDSKEKDIEEMLNQALMGMVFPEENIINVGNSYKESIADIVMCVNLNLTIEEYFAKMSEVFHKYNKDTQSHKARLVIVAAYLMMGKKEIKEYKKEYKRKEWLQDKWRNKFNDLLKSGKLPENFSKVIENYYMIIDDKLFDVTMCRVSEIIDRIMLVENVDEFDFVRKSLRLGKGNNAEETGGKKQSEERQKIQQKEIEFILKYYYQNRQMYAGKNGIEAETEDSKGGDSHVHE